MNTENSWWKEFDSRLQVIAWGIALIYSPLLTICVGILVLAIKGAMLPAEHTPIVKKAPPKFRPRFKSQNPDIPF